jgi:glucose-1-phosphate adenylyltransferase
VARPAARRGNVLALVQAGGAGSRMDVLTRERAKPALPFGGVHRLVDFTLSALVHAELRDVWVSVEYQVASIDEYLSGGRPWDLDSSRGGFRRMVPQTGSGPATEDRFAYGNGDLLLRMARDLEAFGAETLVVSSADHVFSADLRPVIDEHVRSGKTATLLTAEVSLDEAGHNVTVETDADGLVTRVEEKPDEPRTGVVATEIFLYRTEPLMRLLGELRRELSGSVEGDDSGIGDFAEHLLPRLVEQQEVRAVPLAGYWKDLGRPGAYLQGHRDLLAGQVDVHDPDRPVISKWQDRPAGRVRAGALVEDSLLSPGCDVAGEVVRSVIGPGVVVEAGARVEDAVLFEDVVIRRGARVMTSVVDERCVIGRGAVVGELAERRSEAEDDELVLVGQDSTVGDDVAIGAGARLEPGTTA